MNPSRFDRLSRGLATGATRRRLIQVMAGGAAGGLGLVGVHSRALSHAAFQSRLADLDSEEQSVMLYEGMAAIADGHHDSCANLSGTIQQFLTDNKATLDAVTAEQGAWDHADRLAHAERYGDRLEEATKTLTVARSRCQYVPGTGDPAATPVVNCGSRTMRAAPDDVFTLAAQDSCDCDRNCPQSTGNCILTYAECLSGSSCECCFTSYCGSTSKCLDRCQATDCCQAPCDSPDPAPPGPDGD